MRALRLSIDNGLETFAGTLESAMRRASKLYGEVWMELSEMARYPDNENPYLDKAVKREYAMRSKVHRG